MSGVNGHLGSNPEIHRTQDGGAVANFSLAAGESWKEKAPGAMRRGAEPRPRSARRRYSCSVFAVIKTKRQLALPTCGTWSTRRSPLVSG
jgi:hypothetical protein